jgi:hypothetical protein
LSGRMLDMPTRTRWTSHTSTIRGEESGLRTVTV